MLFNEPKLLKSDWIATHPTAQAGFSALQRAEIAEISAEIAFHREDRLRFSALQRAEIAEIRSLA